MRDPLIVLGVDGLDWGYVNEHRAELPNLASWPVLNLLPSILPPDSIPAWTTIFTGEPPGEHGILDSIDYLSKRPEAAAESAARALPHRTFWDEAGRRGKRVCVVNPFMAYPAWNVNGVMVAGPVFVSGEVSVTGINGAELGDVPELGGIVAFPTPRTMSRFVKSTLEATEEQAEFGMRLLQRVRPDLFFLNILTVDRMQHFAWRFTDAGDPTFPGPNRHSRAILDAYRSIDAMAARYARVGRVIIVSDHGHGRRCTKMVFLDEVLRRSGLVAERSTAPRLLSPPFLLERTKRLVLDATYRFGFETPAYRVARRLPGRKAIKQSTFSTNVDQSTARTSRLFGRNRFGGVELRDDTPATRERVRAALGAVRDPDVGDDLFEWIADRETVVSGARIDRYPSLLFMLKPGYGVDFGIYGQIIGPDVNHRRVSGGHTQDGIFAASFPLDLAPARLDDIYQTVLRLV